MRKVALRGLFARKLRLALTVLAVVLGTTLIAGTYVFTDTINSAFDTIFTVVQRGPTRRSRRTRRSTRPTTAAPRRRSPDRCSDKVRRQPGVANAEGSVFDAGTILGKDGKRIGAGGAPNFIASVADVPRFQAFTLKQGRRPQNADEVAIDAATADKEGLKVGDKVCAVATAPRKGYTLVGTTQIAGVELVRRRRGARPAAARGAADARQGRRLRRDPGRRQARRLARSSSRRSWRARSARRSTCAPARSRRDKESKDIRDNLGFLKTFLLAFACIALFVGAFLIFNTFSITVAQRMREFALLRTLGASRRQVWRAVVTEGLAARLRRRRRRLPAGHRDGGAPARAVQGVRRRPAEQGRRHRDAAR